MRINSNENNKYNIFQEINEKKYNYAKKNSYN